MKVNFIYQKIFNKEFISFSDVKSVVITHFFMHVEFYGLSKKLTYSLKRIDELKFED